MKRLKNLMSALLGRTDRHDPPPPPPRVSRLTDIPLTFLVVASAAFLLCAQVSASGISTSPGEETIDSTPIDGSDDSIGDGDSEVSLPPQAYPKIESSATCEQIGWSWWSWGEWGDNHDDRHHYMMVEVRPTFEGNANDSYSSEQAWPGTAKVLIRLKRNRAECVHAGTYSSSGGEFIVPPCDPHCMPEVNDPITPKDTAEKRAADVTEFATNAQDLQEEHDGDYTVEVVVKVLRVTHVEGARSFHRSSTGEYELNVTPTEGINIGGSTSETSGTTDREAYNRRGMLGWYASDPVSVDTTVLKGLRLQPNYHGYAGYGGGYIFIPVVKTVQNVAAVTDGEAEGEMLLPGGLHLHPIAHASHICPNGIDPDSCGSGKYTGDPPSEDI